MVVYNSMQKMNVSPFAQSVAANLVWYFFSSFIPLNLKLEQV